MENIRIDSHKLIFHPERVAAWMRGENVTPIYMEISPAGPCNHRCAFCAKDFVGYKPTYLEASHLATFLQEMARAGLKSVMFAGEGEPCLNRDIDRMVRDAKAAGLDVAMTTNGSRLIPSGVCEIVDLLTWVRISMNAGDAETFARIHGVKPQEFDTVLLNLRALVVARRERGAATTIGVQSLLLPENEDQLVRHAELVRDIGVDYYTVKPFTAHPLSSHNQYAEWRCSKVETLREALAALETDTFKVFFRAHAIEKIANKQRSYRCCHALPFWSYLDSKGALYACSTYLGDERFNYGNMYESSFEEIWNSEKKRSLFADLEKNVNLERCRWGCRMDEVNQYLWDLAHPGRHVNFI